MAYGEMYAACQAGCSPSQLELLVVPPLYAKGSEFDAGHWEPSEKAGVLPPEGGATEEMERSHQVISEPPVEWLSTLWSGGIDGETP